MISKEYPKYLYFDILKIINVEKFIVMVVIFAKMTHF
jgi:hypothetical protein